MGKFFERQILQPHLSFSYSADSIGRRLQWTLGPVHLKNDFGISHGFWYASHMNEVVDVGSHDVASRPCSRFV